MKVLGLKIDTLFRINNWLDDNIDQMFEAIQRKNGVKYNQLVDPSARYKQKMKLKSILMTKAELLINSKNTRARVKQVQSINKHSSVSVNYELKNCWVENLIEKRFRYFDNRSETNNILTMVKSLQKKPKEKIKSQ